MEKTSSQSKAHMAPVGVAAVLGMTGMGLVSSGVVAADTTSATDTISVTVQPSCTFSSVEDETYVGSAANGTEVNNFNDSGVHEFNLFCNDNNGFIVSATAYDLEATGVEDVIAYTDNYTHTGVNSMWTAGIASDTEGITVVNQVVPTGGGTIISSDSHTTASGASFTATYDAYVGTATPAGTYTGTIVYTLTASGTSNNSNNGNSGTNSGNEVTDNSGNDNGGGSNTGGSGTGTNSTPSNSPSNSPSNTPSNAPLAMTPSNNYSTYNTYNTTNYNDSGAGTTGTQLATNGNISDTTGDTTSEDDDRESSLGVTDSYANPLGVTTSTASSSEGDDSGIDLMPIIAVGAALAAAGVAAIAMSQSENKE